MAVLVKHFGLARALELAPRFNIAPTQDTAVVRADRATHERQLSLLHWGLIPSWAKDQSVGNRMINARGETVAEKPSFRTALRRRRCLIPADGFYEWQKTGGAKQPYLIEFDDGRPFAFAGLWESWHSGAKPADPGCESAGPVIESCTIITTEASEMMRELHERMPVILDENDYATWLDPALQDPADVAHLIMPYPADSLRARPVSTHVNKPANDDPKCVEVQQRLF